MIIQQTVFPFKIETTKERLTAHRGLALMAEFNHGIGLRELSDQYLPTPGSNRVFYPSVIVDALPIGRGRDASHPAPPAQIRNPVSGVTH